MNAEERDIRIAKMMKDDLALLARKGHDYSGDKDALANFRDFGSFGILIRLNDKFKRLTALMSGGPEDRRVKDEGIQDTLQDICNYVYLMRLVMEEENETTH